MAVDGDPRPRGPRSSARQLKDISHLYLSGRAAAKPAWQASTRRRLRVGVLSNGPAAAKAEVCANLAVQFARLQQRTLVLDLDASLPNVGFHLGLEPRAYMAHLWSDAGPGVERGLLGLRVVEGLAGWQDVETLPEELRLEIRDSQCVLLCLPPPTDGAVPALERWAPLLEAPVAPTTLARVAAHSPMFGAWMATATRAPEARGSAARLWDAPAPRLLDAALWVLGAAATPSGEVALRHLADALAPTPLHRLVWGDEATPTPGAWARLPSHPLVTRVRQPLSALYPEHPVARVYESLAQSLLAGLGRRTGTHA